MIQLSANFTLEELTRSQVALRTGTDNDPTKDPDVMANLKRLCADVLEPARRFLGVPLHVDSGYRSPLVNDWVGGAKDSAHMYGRAADVIPMGVELLQAFQLLMHSGIPYDQCIFECKAWIHVSVAPLGETPRGENLLASGHPGAWVYEKA
jgi:uncharacterized protein YcbK (DUF882 family)